MASMIWELEGPGLPDAEYSSDASPEAQTYTSTTYKIQYKTTQTKVQRRRRALGTRRGRRGVQYRFGSTCTVLAVRCFCNSMVHEQICTLLKRPLSLLKHCFRVFQNGPRGVEAATSRTNPLAMKPPIEQYVCIYIYIYIYIYMYTQRSLRAVRLLF